MKARTILLVDVIFLLAILSVTCTEPNPEFEEDDFACSQGQLVIEPFNLAQPYQVDILLVVDSSPGMLQAQEALAEAMPSFVQALNAIEGLDYHMGVVSTDVISDEVPGELQTGLEGQTGCPGDRQRIITRTTVGGPRMAACNVVLGEDGDDFEAGLLAVHYALTGPTTEIGGANEKFLRADSRVIVVVFSNEDDCSDYGDLDRVDPAECQWDAELLAPLSDFATPRHFRLVRGGHGGQPVDFVAIVGPDDGVAYSRPDPPQPVCAANGMAYGGSRYIQVVETLEDRGGFFNICTRSYQGILAQVLEQHILPRPEILCPQLHLTQPPALVQLVNPQAGSSNAVVLSEDYTGYLYLGPDEVCPTGRVWIAPDPLGTLGSEEELHVYYCTADPLPGT
ncbi:MAG: hypothetical protein JW797_11900 [Bradymonadales bacterium]|nr:hypothetical protein [Bradymonadales bacterium]